MLNERARQKLLQLRRADEEERSRLLDGGVLFAGYAPDMERVHLENARQLEAMIAKLGWPGRALVGDDGCEAAWLIAQHAISNPNFQRRCLESLRRAVEDGDAPPHHEAYLTDRILFNQGKPQRYGTIFDWDENWEISAGAIESPETVDERRTKAGLPPLAAALERVRREGEREGNEPPVDIEARRRELDDWRRRVGWI